MKTFFKNAKIIDGLGNPAFMGSVLVSGNKIVSVNKGNSITRKDKGHIETIDAKGRTLMPGLIDAHCHVTLDETHSNDEMFFHRREGLGALVAAYNAKKVLRAGVTGFLDADCLFDLGVDLRDGIESGITIGPRMATGGNALVTSLGGTAGRLIPDSGLRGYAKVVTTKDEIVAEVSRQIKIGVDWIKVHITGLIPRQKHRGEVAGWTYDELKLVCDTAHDLGIPVVGHCRNAKSITDAIRAGFDMILHATFMDEQALELLIEKKTPIVPTFTFQANLADFGDKVGADPSLKAIFRREIEESSEMIQRAYKAGVPVLCGTESGFSLTPYGEWHYREMEVFIKDMGFSPEEAIRAATSECARAIGLHNQVGAIQEGRLADLILVDGDPLKDIKVLGDKNNIQDVMLDGTIIDLPELPDRQEISGWKVSPYSTKKLLWNDVN